MTYTATQLITNAYYLSSVLSKDVETITSSQLTEGLALLNAVLAVKSANTKRIPYYKPYDMTLSAGVQEYFIPNLVEVSSFTFFIGTVRYSLIRQDRREYFGSPRVIDINSLPNTYHVERCFNGSNIYLYFNPEGDYPAQIVGKFSLTDIGLNEDLSLTYDSFYIEYLRYALASRISDEYNIVWLPQNEKNLKEIEDIINTVSPMDMTLKKVSSLQSANTGADIYLDANVAKGWRP